MEGKGFVEPPSTPVLGSFPSLDLGLHRPKDSEAQGPTASVPRNYWNELSAGRVRDDTAVPLSRTDRESSIFGTYLDRLDSYKQTIKKLSDWLLAMDTDEKAARAEEPAVAMQGRTTAHFEEPAVAMRKGEKVQKEGKFVEETETDE